MPANSDPTSSRRTADAIVIGDGIIGLSTALELARRGVHCVVFGVERPGIASFAAAGLLAPSIGQLPAAARSFFQESLRLFPPLLQSLAKFDPDLRLVSGLLVLGDGSGSPEPTGNGKQLSSDEARRLEPSIEAPRGAVFYSHDGAVDNVRVMRALRRAANQPGIELIAEAPVSEIEVRRGQVTVTTDSGPQATARRAILAAGAWAPQIRGLPRPIPVFPLKGQMLSLNVCPLSRAVVGNGVYLVPREGETVIGSTSERSGFDVSTTPDVIDRLRTAATGLCPPLAAGDTVRAWAGVRPATPDMLPIIGADPEHPELLYACGLSRNGILLAPATAVAVADLTSGKQSRFDLSGFGIARFDSTPGSTNLIPDA